MPNIGDKLGHFKILKKLGAGGMGSVYLAEDLKLGRKVAIKTISSEHLNSTESISRFEREARTAAQISHPNVMAIHEIGTVDSKESGDSSKFIVMEYVKGVSLGDYLNDTKPDMKGLVRIAEKIAAGIAACCPVHSGYDSPRGELRPDRRTNDAESGLNKPAPDRGLRLDSTGSRGHIVCAYSHNAS